MKRKDIPAGGKKRPFLIPLLGFLFVAFAISSGMLGFLLGRNAARSTGQLIDTIVLAPVGSSHVSETARRSLTGRVLYAAGEPCAGATIRLGEGEKSDRTDSQGKFYFADVDEGEHKLEILDEDGRVLAETALSLSFSEAGEAGADRERSVPVFRMPPDVQMLELTLTIGEGSSLEVQEGSAYFTTRNGEIVDFSSSMLQLPTDSFAVTPSGNLVTPEGYVLLLSRETVLAPSGDTAEIIPGAGATVPGVTVTPEGSAQTEGGVIVRPSGTVTLPDGETVEPGNDVIFIEQDTAGKVEELPQPYPPEIGETGPANGPDNVPHPEEDPDEEEPNGEETDASSSLSTAPEPIPTPAPTPNALEFQNTSDVSWQQQSLVDLFRRRDQGNDLGEENGVPLIAPGTSGFYEFRLQNREEFDIEYTVAFQEKSIHLPILYSIVDTSDNHYYLRREKSSLDGGICSAPILIPAGTTQTYRVEWEWQYEDWYMPERDNAQDTSAAQQQDRAYLVSLAIKAEQRNEIYQPDDDTKYPGQRPYTRSVRDRPEGQRKKTS